jgi:hypothetical protein
VPQWPNCPANGQAVAANQRKARSAAMIHHRKSLAASLVVGLILAAGMARADDPEKVPLDKLPKAVTDAVTAKFPKAKLKSATKEKQDSKLVYEIVFNVEKQHLHALVTAEGKLFEIHRHIDAKDLPDKVAKAVKAKYPKAEWENIDEMSNADGKVIGYEVEVVISANNTVEVVVDPSGKILKETKQSTKKDAK